MRILILANNDIGLYKFRKELIEELVKKNNKVFIALPYGESIEPLKDMGCKFINTPIDRRGINPIKDIKLLFRYNKIINKIKPNMVITYTIKPNIYGGIASRKHKVSYCCNITGLGTAFEEEGFIKKLVICMYKFSCKKAKIVFFENVENQSIFINYKIIDKKQTCLLNGAGVNLSEYRLIEYPQNKELHFLFVGRVMKEKGIDELFVAMKKLIANGVECLLDMVGEYEEDYKEEIHEYEREGWLKYHGFQKDVIPFISKTDCFVLPSWHEGMANTNLENAASGRPIITTNIHGCLEAVIDGKTGYLVERKNAEELYKAMKKFVELPYEERKKMGLEGRKHMEDVFDKRKVVEKTIVAIER